MTITLSQWHELMDMTSQYIQLSSKRKAEGTMRTFKNGATRDSDDTKLDFEGYLSPLALTRYAEYMNLHQIQADGNIRDSDNWQKGIPAEAYVKGLFRHFVDLWTTHRGYIATDRKDGHVIDSEEALCAVIFNAFGLLHETLVDKGTPPLPAEAATNVQVQADNKKLMFGLPPEAVADYTHGEN